MSQAADCAAAWQLACGPDDRDRSPGSAQLLNDGSFELSGFDSLELKPGLTWLPAPYSYDGFDPLPGVAALSIFVHSSPSSPSSSPFSLLSSLSSF